MEVIELAGIDWKVSYLRGSLPDGFSASSLSNLASSVPGSIQMDLLNLKMVDDPYKFGEELKQRWIGMNLLLPLPTASSLFHCSLN